jgi:hypothetical protein
MVTVGPAEQCRGVTDWSDCIQTRDPGVVERADSQVNTISSRNMKLFVFAFLAVASAGLYVFGVSRRNALRGRFKHLKPAERSDISDHVEE